MKSVRLHFTPDDEQLHPMYESVVDHETFKRTEPHRRNPTVVDRSTIVFEVLRTDVEAYEAAFVEMERILSYGLSQLPGDPSFIVVDERLDVAGARQTVAVTRGGLIVVPPVVFDGDGTALMTLVGTDEALQPVAEQPPEGRGLEVIRVRECTGPGSISAGPLPSRQREAVEAAVDCGYYREPWTGAAVDVTARLDCSTSTMAERLRKAEMRVMADLVSRSWLRVGS